MGVGGEKGETSGGASNATDFGSRRAQLRSKVRPGPTGEESTWSLGLGRHLDHRERITHGQDLHCKNTIFVVCYPWHKQGSFLLPCLHTAPSLIDINSK